MVGNIRVLCRVRPATGDEQKRMGKPVTYPDPLANVISVMPAQSNR